MPEPYSLKYNKPHLHELLSILKMDKEFHSAKGNYLYSNENKKTMEYLDLAGGYGSLLLGHNHPDLVSTAKDLLKANICFHNQLSAKPNLQALCKRINELISAKTKSNYCTNILNSGAEAIEAALKHALLAFHNNQKAIKKEIDQSLLIINESYFYQNPGHILQYKTNEFQSIEEIRSYLSSFNDNVFNKFKPKIIASNRSFHGKTIGALSVTSNPKFRNPFIKNTPFQTIFIDIHAKCPEEIFETNKIEILIPKLTSKGQLSFKKRSFSMIVAAIIEPIIGEGGIHVVSENFLNELRSLTSKHKIPLIFDEIQSGCFRTGLFLASFHNKVSADYYILGKSLGGGISKISAVSIRENLYIPEFDLLHSSTFAEDDYSSLIALKSLKLLSENSDRIKDSSDSIFKALTSLKHRYPKIIRDVRGLGLMIGISFESQETSSSFGLQGIYRSSYFGYVLAAYLLNEKNIRVSVTLSDSHTLRLLPSLFITENQIKQVFEALDALCEILEYGDFYSLVSFLLPEEYKNLRPIRNFKSQTIPLDDLNGCVNQVGFLLHYIDIHTIRAYLPSLAILPEEAIIYLIQRLRHFSEPVVIGRNRIENGNGEKICITFIGLSYTAKMISDDMRESLGNISNYQLICNKAIDLLYGLGITKIGLGQYNSIIMQNGKAVSNPNVRVTTGNGFTTFAVYQKIKEYIKAREGTKTKLAIVGAGGNIAKILSALIVNQVDEILLLGRSNGNSNKTMEHAGYLIQEIIADIEKGADPDNKIYNQIKTIDMGRPSLKSASNNNYIDLWKAYDDQNRSEKRIQIGIDLELLADSDIVVVATSDPTPFLKKRFFKTGVLICDISVPLNCDDEVLNDTDIRVIKGGIIDLPQGENLYPPGLYLEKGQAYACMVETILMGFERTDTYYSFGEIVKDQVNGLGRRLLAQGFTESTYKKELMH